MTIARAILFGSHREICHLLANEPEITAFSIFLPSVEGGPQGACRLFGEFIQGITSWGLFYWNYPILLMCTLSHDVYMMCIWLKSLFIHLATHPPIHHTLTLTHQASIYPPSIHHPPINLSFIHASFHPSIQQSTHPTIFPLTHTSTHISTHLSICLSISIYLYPFFNPFIHLFTINLFIHSSFYAPTHSPSHPLIYSLMHPYNHPS